MKKLGLVGCIMLTMCATAVSAQSTLPPPPPMPVPSTSVGANVTASDELNKPDAPKAGANSFTEAQAKSRIEAHGIGEVGPLAKDNDGIWRGKAVKSTVSVDVAVDFEGNVVAR